MTDIEMEIDTPDHAAGRRLLLVALLFSLFFFLPNLLAPQYFDAQRWLAGLAIYGLFIAIYLAAITGNREWALSAVALIALLSTLGTAITPGTSALFGYGVFFAGLHMRTDRALLTLVAYLLLILVAAVAFSHIRGDFLAPAILLSVSLCLYGIMIQRDIVRQHQLQRNQREMQQMAGIAERERIGRDLHDSLGHTLSSIALKSELAHKLLTKGESVRAAEEIAQVAELCRQSLAEMRETVAGIRHYGFPAELEAVCESLQERGIAVSINADAIQLSPALESTLALLLREACTNILRHSNADKAQIDLSVSQGRLTLCIKDNGRGSKLVPGIGLRSMRHRCLQHSGKMEINTEDGIEILFSFPQAVESLT